MLRCATLLAFTVLTALPLTLTACEGAWAVAPASARPQAARVQAKAKAVAPAQVTVQEAAKLLAANPGLRFIDVRTPEEFAEVRAKGTTNLPLADLAIWSAGLPKDQPLLLICRSGSRSGKACAALAEKGFTKLTNVQGGTLAWEAEKLPMDK
jgi:rhodanese-related sulfurtransferase